VLSRRVASPPASHAPSRTRRNTGGGLGRGRSWQVWDVGFFSVGEGGATWAVPHAMRNLASNSVSVWHPTPSANSWLNSPNFASIDAIAPAPWWINRPSPSPPLRTLGKPGNPSSQTPMPRQRLTHTPEQTPARSCAGSAAGRSELWHGSGGQFRRSANEEAESAAPPQSKHRSTHRAAAPPAALILHQPSRSQAPRTSDLFPPKNGV